MSSADRRDPIQYEHDGPQTRIIIATVIAACTIGGFVRRGRAFEESTWERMLRESEKGGKRALTLGP